MGLQAQAPLRMVEAIAQSGLCVGVAARTVHGLQEEMAEGESLEAGGIDARLRINEL